uniref:ADP-ribosylglycohydrolase n=1 Tax=viral metagenome TaxID=1070528 RepID=A0A6C0ACC1_9ZZZZ
MSKTKPNNKKILDQNIKNKLLQQNKTQRIHLSLILHALGDTIGYYNSNWEFNYNYLNADFGFVYELISEFIDLGGINCIDLKGWKVSDDTVLHICVGNALVSSNNVKEFVKILKKNMVNSLEDISKRHPGMNTIRKLKLLKKNHNMKFEFDEFSGGSGGSMRSPVIGLFFDKIQDQNKIIRYALESALITHNHPTGYLGAIATALFTNYAINRVPIETWCFNMLKIIESPELDGHIKQEYPKLHSTFKDYKHSFIGKWKSYIKDKFTKKKEIRLRIRNLAERGAFYTNNFSWKHPKNKGFETFIGSSGDDSLIVAYDSLLDSDHCFEKLVIYSMLHIGDTDTTGCIAGALYGAYYGDKYIPENITQNIEKNLEYKKQIDDLYDSIKNKE